MYLFIRCFTLKQLQIFLFLLKRYKDLRRSVMGCFCKGLKYRALEKSSIVGTPSERGTDDTKI